jgi:hypothetical protein
MQKIIRPTQALDRPVKTALFAKTPETPASQFGKKMETPISFSPKALQCYMATCKWAADVDFYRRENHFFRLLIENYTYNAIDVQHLGQLDNALHHLTQQAAKIEVLRKSLAEHLQKLMLIGKKKAIEDLEWLADAHVNFDARISRFAVDYRNEKLALFNLIEEFSI